MEKKEAALKFVEAILEKRIREAFDKVKKSLAEVTEDLDNPECKQIHLLACEIMKDQVERLHEDVKRMTDKTKQEVGREANTV